MPTKKKAVKRTAKNAPAGAGAKVLVGRFGENPVRVTAKRGATVGAVLEQAGFAGLASNERVWLNNKRTTKGAKVRNGDILAIVTPKQAG